MCNYWFSYLWHQRRFEFFKLFYICQAFTELLYVITRQFLLIAQIPISGYVQLSIGSPEYGVQLRPRPTHSDFLIRRPLLAIFDLFVSCLSVKLLKDCHCWVPSNKNRTSIAFYFSGIAFWCTFANTTHIFFVLTLRPTARLSVISCTFCASIPSSRSYCTRRMQFQMNHPVLYKSARSQLPCAL